MASADWWHLVPAALLTCLLPDIDHPKSVLGQRLKWLSQPIARAFGHRGFTHSLLAVAVSLWLFQINVPADRFLPADVLQGMTLGYLSHIVADMLTPAGVPLLSCLSSTASKAISWSARCGFRPACRRLALTAGRSSCSTICRTVLAGW
ncbi:hypothetical protein E05_12220 [Plautia stali symbiont]|nr:hypothetical protein E05_12220 [Plautia stali symbiont]